MSGEEVKEIGAEETERVETTLKKKIKPPDLKSFPLSRQNSPERRRSPEQKSCKP